MIRFCSLAALAAAAVLVVGCGGGGGGMPSRRTSVASVTFPMTASLFRSMLDREAQLSVAKFLMADGAKREEMRNGMNWARSATEPLIAQFTNNVSAR